MLPPLRVDSPQRPVMDDRSARTPKAEQTSPTEIDGTDPAAVADSALRGLTARQLQVVALLADGLRYEEIAACLAISERQVQRHVSDATIRLGLRNANHLTAVAASEGLVPPR